MLRFRNCQSKVSKGGKNTWTVWQHAVQKIRRYTVCQLRAHRAVHRVHLGISLFCQSFEHLSSEVGEQKRCNLKSCTGSTQFREGILYQGTYLYQYYDPLRALNPSDSSTCENSTGYPGTWVVLAIQCRCARVYLGTRFRDCYENTRVPGHPGTRVQWYPGRVSGASDRGDTKTVPLDAATEMQPAHEILSVLEVFELDVFSNLRARLKLALKVVKSQQNPRILLVAPSTRVPHLPSVLSDALCAKSSNESQYWS